MKLLVIHVVGLRAVVVSTELFLRHITSKSGVLLCSNIMIIK